MGYCGSLLFIRNRFLTFVEYIFLTADLRETLIIRNLFICIVGLLMSSCATSKKSVRKGEANVRHELLDARTFKITKFARDKTYGYSEDNPVKVGGGMEGPLNEQRFLNALAGPNGEKVTYKRQGSCCPFKTPNALFGDSGVLDMYEVIIEGSSEKIILYLNMYDSETLQVPVGFTLRK